MNENPDALKPVIWDKDSGKITPIEETDAYKVFDGTAKLAELDHRGLIDSPEADAIRDEMDEPWMKLTDEEKRLAWEFSESLGYPGDPRDWRIEGTTANLEVERLLARSNFWFIASAVLMAVLIVGMVATLALGLADDRTWLKFVWIGNYVAVLVSYNIGFRIFKRVGVIIGVDE